jgi:hypothetical protein
MRAYFVLGLSVLLLLGCGRETSRTRRPAISFCLSVPPSGWYPEVEVKLTEGGSETFLPSGILRVRNDLCTRPYIFTSANIGSYGLFRVRVTGPMVPVRARFFSQTGQAGEVPMTRELVAGHAYNYWVLHVHVPPTESSGVASVMLYPGDPGQL